MDQVSCYAVGAGLYWFLGISRMHLATDLALAAKFATEAEAQAAADAANAKKWKAKIPMSGFRVTHVIMQNPEHP